MLVNSIERLPGFKLCIMLTICSHHHHRQHTHLPPPPSPQPTVTPGHCHERIRCLVTDSGPWSPISSSAPREFFAPSRLCLFLSCRVCVWGRSGAFFNVFFYPVLLLKQNIFSGRILFLKRICLFLCPFLFPVSIFFYFFHFF